MLAMVIYFNLFYGRFVAQPDYNYQFVEFKWYIAKDLAFYFSTTAYYQCVRKTSCGAKSYEVLSAQAQLNADLNNAPASVSGALVKFNKSNRVYYFICSRNNNFSNRSQKGAIHVVN